MVFTNFGLVFKSKTVNGEGQGSRLNKLVSKARTRLFFGNTLIGALESGGTKNQSVCAALTTTGVLQTALTKA